MNELRTERLLLRRWQESDREPWAALNADPEVMRFFPSTLDREQADAWFTAVDAHFDEHGYGLWAVDVDGRFAGFTGLRWTDVLQPDVGNDLEVGWRLARWAWGHGYATESARAALQVAAEHVDQVISITAVANTPSRAVMERLGMQLAGEFDHPRIVDGHPLQPHVLYTLDV